MTKKIVFETQPDSEVVLLPLNGDYTTESLANISYEIDGDLVRLKTGGFLWDPEDLDELIDFLKATKEVLLKFRSIH